MENKTEYQSEIFSNRLKKKFKELRKWARKNRISCYRIYDKDIPEIPVSLDIYEFLPNEISTPLECARFLSEQNEKLSQNNHEIEINLKERTYAVMYLYERPYEKAEEEEENWLNTMGKAAANVLQIKENHIIKKYRKHQSHKDGNQYQKLTNFDENNSQKINEYILSQELGQLFKLNLTDYLDTGLFFDHRPLRAYIRDNCSNKTILNLFCYTGSFSVFAAAGNAKKIESVDMSKTYLDWAYENMKLNGFSDKNKYIFTRADCIAFLQEKAVCQKAILSGNATAEQKKCAQTYDIIILDPPTFSNSKKTNNVLDINKDWPQLVKDCLNLLSPGGTLYFSTNSERLKLDINELPPQTINKKTFTLDDITNQTIPNDFAGNKPHRCWKFTIDK